MCLVFKEVNLGLGKGLVKVFVTCFYKRVNNTSNCLESIKLQMSENQFLTCFNIVCMIGLVDKCFALKFLVKKINSLLYLQFFQQRPQPHIL